VYPPHVLARRFTLPKKPEPVTLRGARVVLEPLDLDRDVEALHAISSGEDCDERIWRYMSGGPFADAAELRAWLAPQVAADDGLPFVVRLGRQPIGVACLIANVPMHLKIELGSIWYGTAYQRWGHSLDATIAMLKYVFDLGYLRAEWKCDAKNEPSRRAALSYGFVFEGIQDAHYIIKDRRRDTAWYRMLAHEWAGTGSPTMYRKLRKLITK
jgi:RimJ/RimL family protein N-acetyltransferase